MAEPVVEELAVEPRASSAPTDPRKAPFGNPIALPWDGEPYPQDGIPYPDPDVFRLVSLNPAAFTVGGANFTLHAIGTGFTAGCRVYVNGAPWTTTFVSPTELTTAVIGASLTVPGTYTVTVQTPEGSATNERPFTVT